MQFLYIYALLFILMFNWEKSREKLKKFHQNATNNETILVLNWGMLRQNVVNAKIVKIYYILLYKWIVNTYMLYHILIFDMDSAAAKNGEKWVMQFKIL